MPACSSMCHSVLTIVAALQRTGTGLAASGGGHGLCVVRNMGRTRLYSSTSSAEVGGAPEGADTQDAASTATVDFSGLKKETSRQVLRAFKKVGKTEERLRKALTKTSGPADDLDSMEQEIEEAKARLKALNKLEEQLSGMKVSAVDIALHRTRLSARSAHCL